MIGRTTSSKPSKVHLALSWAWAALGCASLRPKKDTSNNRYFDWDAEGGYIPYRFQGAYRARWRREDRQARFEESRARQRKSEKEKTLESAKGYKEASVGGKKREIEKPLKPVKESKERHTRKRRPTYVPKMSMTEAHEIMERAIGLQGQAKTEKQMQIEKASDKLFGDDTDPKLGSRSVVGLSKTACAGTGTSKGGHEVDTEGTLAELGHNRHLKSRSVLGLSGVTLVG